MSSACAPKRRTASLTIRADLVVGCDGRHSTVREKAGLKSDDYGAPMDVLWFRVTRKEADSADTFGHVEAGRMMVMLDRGDYWQCAYVIPKGGIEQVKAKGLDAFRDRRRRHVAVPRRPRRRIEKLGRRQAVERDGRPAAKMVAAGADLHRRRRACDVADRRRRHQHGGAGCGRRRQPAGRRRSRPAQ